MEALTAKGQTLAAMYATQQEKVEAARAALQNASTMQQKYSEEVARSEQNIGKCATGACCVE